MPLNYARKLSLIHTKTAAQRCYKNKTKHRIIQKSIWPAINSRSRNVFENESFWSFFVVSKAWQPLNICPYIFAIDLAVAVRCRQIAVAIKKKGKWGQTHTFEPLFCCIALVFVRYDQTKFAHLLFCVWASDATTQAKLLGKIRKWPLD